MLKDQIQLWLLEAQDNMLFMLTKIEELKSFLAQITNSSGKQPSSMLHDRAKRNIQIHAVKMYAAEFTNKHTRQEASKENSNPQVFCQAVMQGTDHPRDRA